MAANEIAVPMTRQWRLALFLAITGSAALVAFETVRTLVAVALSDSASSHVIIIPVISAALIYHQRTIVFERAGSGSWGARAILLLTVAVLVGVSQGRPLAQRADELSLSVAALVAVWLAAFVVVYGWAAARRAHFALGFLLFTIPFPPVVVDATTELLKRGSTDIATALLTLTGTTFHRDGFVLFLPGVALEVADACSGIRSSVALLLTVLLTGHLMLRTGWSRVLIVLAVLPVALLKNGIRITTLSLLATHVDPALLGSRLHRDGGVVFFVIALGLLLPLFSILQKRETRAPRTHLVAH